MPTSMIKPDVVFDGQEFSAMTRFLDAIHDKKDLGVDQDAATAARQALEMNAPVAVDDVKSLVEAAKAYKKLVEDRKLGSGAQVKGEELDHLIEKLEGLEKSEETKDENGKKVHPAAMPPGDDHKQDGKGSDPLPRQGNDVPKLKTDDDKSKAQKDSEKKDAPKK